MDRDEHKDVWGPGIPQYTRDDLLEGEELIKWASEIVLNYELQPNNYEIVSYNFKPGQIPTIVCKKDGKLIFILVRASIYPDEAKLHVDEKKHYIAHAEKFNAEPYFAPVGLMPTDPARMAASLALKNDGYYIKFKGLEKIEFKKSKDWIKQAMKEIRELDSSTQTQVYDTGIRYNICEQVASDFEDWKSEQKSPTFQELLMSCIDQKGLDNTEFYKAAFIDRKLFSAIKNNPNYQPKKETVVACCFGLDLNYPDAEKLLQAAGYNLSMSIPWDRVIYYCLNKRITDIDVVNELLWEEGEKCIRV